MFQHTCAQCGERFPAKKATRTYCSRDCMASAYRAAAIERRGVCSVADCDEPVYIRGWCHPHYSAWRRNGNPDIRHRPRPIEERIAEKVDRRGPDDCWLWTGIVTSRSGHPMMHFEGRTQVVHRLVWMLTHGSLPAPGLVVRHMCGVARCMNPQHLALGTATDNNRDQASWNRAARVLVSRYPDEFSELLQREMANPPKVRPKRRPGRPRKAERKGGQP